MFYCNILTEIKFINKLHYADHTHLLIQVTCVKPTAVLIKSTSEFPCSMCEVGRLSESVRERTGEGEREEEMQSKCDS